MKKVTFIVLIVTLICCLPLVTFAADATLTSADSPYDLGDPLNGHVLDDRITVDANQTVTLTGTAPVGARLRFQNGSVVTLDNVTVDSTGASGRRSGLNINGTVEIHLIGTSTINSEGRRAGIAVMDAEILTIYGPGELISTGGNNGAGIGSNRDQTFGTVIIQSGTVTATGGRNSAGIGGARDSATGGTITIRGGEVYATGSDAAQDLGRARLLVGTVGLELFEPADVFVQRQAAGSATPSPTIDYQDLSSAPAGYSVPATWTYPIGFYGTINVVNNPQTGYSNSIWIVYAAGMIVILVAVGILLMAHKKKIEKKSKKK